MPSESDTSGIISDSDTFSIPVEPQEELVTDDSLFSDINFDTETSDTPQSTVEDNTEISDAESESPALNDDDFSFDDTLKAAESIDNASGLSEEAFPDFDDIDISEDSKIISDSSDTNNDEKVESLFDFDDNYDDTIPTPSISFNDLYDQESIDGVTEEEEEEAVRKTTVPVTICVICAIICIAVLCLLLFFKPVKIFLTGKNVKDSDTAVSKVLENDNYSSDIISDTKEEVIEAVEEITEEAKPEEIVIVESPVVAPVAPQTTNTKPKTVKHHIRWGDTLWDIADAYYKNPWLYKKIAKANGIKNPDLIISGNDIIIPEK